jgi:hypothetical protein
MTRPMLTRAVRSTAASGNPAISRVPSTTTRYTIRTVLLQYDLRLATTCGSCAKGPRHRHGPTLDTRVRIYQLRAEPLVGLHRWLAATEQAWSDQLEAFAAHIGASPEP